MKGLGGDPSLPNREGWAADGRPEALHAGAPVGPAWCSNRPSLVLQAARSARSEVLVKVEGVVAVLNLGRVERAGRHGQGRVKD